MSRKSVALSTRADDLCELGRNYMAKYASERGRNGNRPEPFLAPLRHRQSMRRMAWRSRKRGRAAICPIG